MGASCGDLIADVGFDGVVADGEGFVLAVELDHFSVEIFVPV